LTQSFNEMAQALREARRSDLMELNRSRRATEEVFAHFPAAVAVLDRTGRVEVATPTARKYFNLSPKTAIGDVDVPWMKDLVDRAMREDREVTVNGASRMIQHFVDGKEFFFRPFALPIHDTTGNQTGTLLLFDDVTQLREQEEIKRGVISTVSHQLKTPLTSIRMGIHLLLAEKVGTLSEKQIELLIAARDDSDRLAKMVDDLLEISRIESGRAGVQLQVVPPDLLVMPVMDAFESQAKDQSVTLESQVRSDLDNVKADPSLVSHVFANLVGNALKFTSAGGTITVSAEQEPDCVKFTVADTGPGVPAENLPRVFDPFFRTPDPGGKTGAGLGLTIAKEIIQVHGGRIGVESQPGKGAQFWFTLPAAGPREPTRDIGGSLLIS
jgi:signal transduction histidine kinase